MKITPSFVNYPKNNKNICKIQPPSFKSILATSDPKLEMAYNMYAMINPEFMQIKLSSTRIFRELPCEIAISKLLNPNQKSQINILGCSDGSEAYSYAIALTEEMGKQAQENIKISGVDKSGGMIEIAKSGKIICNDSERLYANQTNQKDGNKSPLSKDGWDRYLTKTNIPDNFHQMAKKYPYLKYLEKDPISGETAGKGFDWYRVNKDKLPEIKFETGTMPDCISGNDEVQNEVYVIANAAGYLLLDNPDDYIKIFKNIKKANKGKNKNIYVVVGNVENSSLSPNSTISPKIKNEIKNSITSLGFKKISDIKLRKLGVGNYKDAANKIYKLE